MSLGIRSWMYLIPTPVIQPFLSEYLEHRTPTELAVQTGVPERRIWGILNYETPNVEFRTADKLLTGLRLAPMCWYEHPDLAPYYLRGDEGVPPDLAKPIKCANPDCEEWFALNPKRPTSWGRRYCSEPCRWRDKARTRDRKKQLARNREWYQRNREKRIAYFRAYRAAQKAA